LGVPAVGSARCVARPTERALFRGYGLSYGDSGSQAVHERTETVRGRKRAGADRASTATVLVLSAGQFSSAVSASLVVTQPRLMLPSAAPCRPVQDVVDRGGAGRRSVSRVIRRLISARLRWMSWEDPFLLSPHPDGGPAGR
jgi:hypothetical protein